MKADLHARLNPSKTVLSASLLTTSDRRDVRSDAVAVVNGVSLARKGAKKCT
jgi:hypothetical protein